ncbi:MAG: cysteine--tRNA ligase [bacterium]
MPDIRLYNTLSKQKEVFTPSHRGLAGILSSIGFGKKTVTMYNCGPTVYQSLHIGNYRAYIFADTLKRALEFNGYNVKQVINITDVGHLVGDGDEGEDKMQVTVQKQQRSSKEISEEYTREFFAGLKALNIETGDSRGVEVDMRNSFGPDRSPATQFPRATGYIPEQITLIEQLEKRGFTYKTSDGVYFDTSKFPQYGKLGNIHLAGLEEGHRVTANAEKRNPTDFALWKFSKETKEGAAPHRDQEWPSPWGVGFPGWHIECSAMAMKLLGPTIDIHTGGIDHIPTHHNNEIAQSEASTGKSFARFWLHGAHLLIDGQKISKSLGNTIYLKDLAAHGVTPLGLRYWFLTASYRTQMNFTWEAVKGAQTAYERLLEQVRGLSKAGGSKVSGNAAEDAAPTYGKIFTQALNDDLNTPKSLAIIWDMMKDTEMTNTEKLDSLREFDGVLGLHLFIAIGGPVPFPAEIVDLKKERDIARRQRDFRKSDELRVTLSSKGYDIVDTSTESTLIKK